MAYVTTVTNLDALITPLQLHYGDLDGITYSEAVYRTALVSGAKMLARRWKYKYYIDSDNNIARNTQVVFTNTAPPILEQGDEYSIILAATVILTRVQLTSSSDSFTSWSTPDLSVSSGAKERALTALYKQALQDVEDWFSRGLAKSRKSFMYSTAL